MNMKVFLSGMAITFLLAGIVLVSIQDTPLQPTGIAYAAALDCQLKQTGATTYTSSALTDVSTNRPSVAVDTTGTITLPSGATLEDTDTNNIKYGIKNANTEYSVNVRVAFDSVSLDGESDARCWIDSTSNDSFDSGSETSFTLAGTQGVDTGVLMVFYGTVGTDGWTETLVVSNAYVTMYASGTGGGVLGTEASELWFLKLQMPSSASGWDQTDGIYIVVLVFEMSVP